MISLTDLVDEKKYADTAKNRSLGRVGKDWGAGKGGGEPEDKPFGGDTGKDADYGQPEDEGPKELEKGAKVTAKWTGVTGDEQSIPDGEIEDVKYTERGTEYVIRWNNGNNLIELPADKVKGEEPTSGNEKSSYFDDPADLSPSQKAHTAAADAELDRIDKEKLAKGEPLDGTPLFPDDEEPEQSAYDKMGPEARELKNTMDSTEEGYQQQYVPILKNLSRKMKKGTYDKEKAVKLMMYYVSNGAKRYEKDFGGGGATGPSVGGFDKKTREEAARAYVEDFEDDWDNKNWDFMESITFNGNKYRRVNEGWWDDLSDAAQAAYIEKHGSAPNVAGDDDEKETIRPEKKKTSFKFGKRKLSWKKDPGTRRRREYTEFIWNCIEEGDIRYQQLKDFAINNRIVSPSFFGTETKAIGSDSELHTILDAIEEDFDPEKIMDEKELQGQIAVFLKTRFKGKDVEREIPMQEGSGEKNFVDIVVDNVYALEVKLPTTRTTLRNLKGQLEEYQEKYPFLGVVIGDKTKLATDSDSEFYDSQFEENLPVWIKEYTDKYKVDLGIRSVVFNIIKRKIGKRK